MQVASAFDYRPAPMHRESGKVMQAVLMNREEVCISVRPWRVPSA